MARFKDALAGFIEFRKYTGPSPELAENTGHVYNTLGQLQEAERCFTESLDLMDLPTATAKSKYCTNNFLGCIYFEFVKMVAGQTREECCSGLGWYLTGKVSTRKA